MSPAAGAPAPSYWRAVVERARQRWRGASGWHRARLIGSYAGKAAEQLALWALQGLLFNRVCLKGWVRLLKGRVECFGNSHTIGDLVMMEYYLKRKRRRGDTILSLFLVNKPCLANAYLARLQARVWTTRGTRFIFSRFLCRLLAPLERQLFFAGPTANMTQHPQEYHELNRADVVHAEDHVTPEERQRARSLMERLGLPIRARFVCVHAREAGFKAALQRSGHNTFRDIDIATYVPAIDALTREGFWIVRMGEPTVAPLPSMPMVVDYARSALKSECLDVVLMAECEFLLGCNSGFSQLAHLFNKRALWTNSVPIEMCPWDDLALWIPRLMFSRAEGRCLTFPEIIGSEVGRYHRTQQYEAAGLAPQGNTPEDILAATRELLAWVRGEPVPEEDRRAQERFNALFPSHYNAYGTRSRICASFIRAHADLMPSADGMPELDANRAIVS